MPRTTPTTWTSSSGPRAGSSPRPDLLGRQCGDGDLAADVDTDDGGSSLVHRHLVGPLGIGSAAAEDPVGLDLRADPVVGGTQRPRSASTPSTSANTTVNRPNTSTIGSRVISSTISGSTPPASTTTSAALRLVDETVDARGRAPSPCDRDEDDGARQPDEDRERDDRTTPAAPIGAHPERDSRVHPRHWMRHRSRGKDGAHPYVGVVAPSDRASYSSGREFRDHVDVPRLSRDRCSGTSSRSRRARWRSSARRGRPGRSCSAATSTAPAEKPAKITRTEPSRGRRTSNLAPVASCPHRNLVRPAIQHVDLLIGIRPCRPVVRDEIREHDAIPTRLAVGDRCHIDDRPARNAIRHRAFNGDPESQLLVHERDVTRCAGFAIDDRGRSDDQLRGAVADEGKRHGSDQCENGGSARAGRHRVSRHRRARRGVSGRAIIACSTLRWRCCGP